MSRFKQGLVVLTLLIAVGILSAQPLSWWQSIWHRQSAALSTVSAHDQQLLLEAINHKAKNQWVQGFAVVTRHLADDTKGSRHQRILIDVEGYSILLSHNIDLAPAIPNLAVGTTIAFRGEYVWNAKGGVVHWTHHDPSGARAGGWILVGGQRYE